MRSRIIGFMTLFLSLIDLSTAFVPQDNYLINCGSDRDAIVENRNFVGDSEKPGFFQGKSVVVKNQRSFTSNLSFLYSTARVFTTASATYSFDIKRFGTHLVRLHFSPFIYENFNLHKANFSVSANGVSLLRDFSVGSNNSVLKEFVLMVDKVELSILFTPTRDFGFVNAIEVLSAPVDLILDPGIKLVSPNGIVEFNQNVTLQTLETVYRVNVGGPQITPFNDTLWRTWIPDEDFLVFKSTAKLARISHAPNYRKGGATKEIAPDNVYMTAQQMDWEKATSDFMFNITWDFPIGVAPKEDTIHYFVRLHFCDIVSSAPNQLYFNVYINEVMAYKDLDLSALTFHVLASPYYLDFVVVNKASSGILQISVGPSDLSGVLRKNAILNGVEIMKMLNVVSPAGARVYKWGNIWVLIVSLVGGVVGLMISLAFFTILIMSKCRKKKPKPKQTENAGWTPLQRHGGSSKALPEGTELVSSGPNGYLGLRIPFADIQSATSNFNKSLIVGTGGFGMVYKGVLSTDNNRKVAVKRCMPGSKQGLPEFHTEISVLSKIRHCHLVSLVGYCEEQSEMILVYEYVENGALKKYLYGNNHLPPLSWKQRVEICIGAARGLHYLHTGFSQGIIHRDIKSTNILLDENFVAKVADFGLSRSGPCLDETHVSTGVKGSFGYLDPEYYRRQQLTDKSDVYSFGVVLFEVLCARPAIDPLLEREHVNLGEWAMQWQKRGQLDQIIDPNLRGQIKPSALRKFGETAVKCLADYGVDRPTMGDVLWNLEYVLQLQENESDEAHLPSSLENPPPLRAYSASSSLADHGDAASDISTSQVFSQLLTHEGR
ncbi:unnamed protein product [Cuscuta epithymum]|uniref:Protein kinase domain-containing protein n=1 Tax=Cuscuta epithymum TaxID=186058 RepID=A0AAV0E3J5_9ASTE|nr:unnamed protein product [Cuscuta epithymum]